MTPEEQAIAAFDARKYKLPFKVAQLDLVDSDNRVFRLSGFSFRELNIHAICAILNDRPKQQGRIAELEAGIRFFAELFENNKSVMFAVTPEQEKVILDAQKLITETKSD